MQRLVLLQAIPDDPEIAVVKLDAEEREEFIQNPLAFVNDHSLFCKPVSHVHHVTQATKPSPPAEKKMAKSASRVTNAQWLGIVVHYPSCVCNAFCVPAADTAVSVR